MEGVIETMGLAFSVSCRHTLPFFRGIIGLMIKAYLDNCIESGRVATGGVMKSAFMLGAAALVASCVFTQDVFAQRGGFREAGFRAAAPGYIGRPKIRVVVWSSLRWAGPPRLIYYPYSDLPYVPVGTPAFYLAGHAGKSDSCWAWDGFQWLNFCSGYYPGF